MRVLIGSETYAPDLNGASRFTQRLVGGLQRAGHDVTVVAPAKRVVSSVSDRQGVTVYRVPSLPIPGYEPYRLSMALLARRFVERAVGERQPDVIHIQNTFGVGQALARVARARGIPLVATNHFVPENFAPHVHIPAPLKRRAIARTWRSVARVLNQAAIVTSPTETAAALLGDHGVRVPIWVISGGIDLAEFGSPRERTAPGVREARTCLYVGRLEPEKHVDELIRALALVRRRMDVRLVAVGNGTQLEALQRLAREAGVADSVAFTGFVPDSTLRQYYQQCDVFCMPGTAELQCLAAMEAMASGRPIVVADALALPELVQPGVNGYTFRPGDVADLAARLLDALADPDRTARMGRSSREMIERHALQHTIAAFERCYRTVIDQSRGLSAA